MNPVTSISKPTATLKRLTKGNSVNPYSTPEQNTVGRLNTRVIAFGVLFAMIAAVFQSAQGQQNTRNILVLHSYHQGLQWSDNVSEAIITAFQDHEDEIELHFEYLDTKRIPGEEYLKQLMAFEKYKFRQANITFEVIISSDNNALRILADREADLYPGVPVVFCGVNNFKPEMLNGRQKTTGVVEAIDYHLTLELIKKLHPKRRKVVVILDKTPTGIAIKQEFDAVAARFSDVFSFEYYQDFTLDEVPGRISSLGEDSVIFLLTFNRDRNGTFISYVDGIKMIKNASNVPIYGSWDFYFGRGIVGGMITSGYSQGSVAAKLAKQILSGVPAEKIPYVLESPNQYMFDYEQMSRFHIKMSDLPENSFVINQPPGFIDRYKRGIAAGLAGFMLVAIVLAWRLFVHKRRQRILIETNIELDRRVAEQTKILEEKNSDLKHEIKERIAVEEVLVEKKDHLEAALAKVKTLSGLLPICASCKKIRDDKGYWNQIESYIDAHSDATFSHGMCPSCAKELYPDLYGEDEEPGAV